MVRQVPKVHVRFDGRSYDWALERLGLDIERAATADDFEIKQRAAQALDVAPGRLEHHVIDRPETGNIILRPAAVYG